MNTGRDTSLSSSLSLGFIYKISASAYILIILLISGITK